MSADNPYLSPYTMPDGTTRRALVERVPECRPQDDGTLPLTFVERCVLAERRLGSTVAEIAKKNGCTKERARSLLRKAEAKSVPHPSILREAVEAWVFSLNGSVFYMSRDHGPFVSVDAYKDNGLLGPFETYADTIHDALVADAHALADAKGIDP